MSEMVERVAKALHKERHRLWQERESVPHPEVFTWEMDNEAFREQLRQEARACIEAMKEPISNLTRQAASVGFDRWEQIGTKTIRGALR